MFTIRGEFLKNEAFRLAEIHQEELLLLRKEKRELMEKVLIQQDRINMLYQENTELRQKYRDLEEFQRGSKSGLFLKNMIIFRLKTFREKCGFDKLLREWENATTHGQVVHVFGQIMYLLGLDYYVISEEKPAEPDIIGISYYSVPPFVILVEVKTITGKRKLGTSDTSQVISKIRRYCEIYRGFRVCPVIVTNVEKDRISDEAVRDCVNNAVILTKRFVACLIKNHFEHKYTPSLLYTLLEPKENPIPSIDEVKFMNILSEQENARLAKEVIKFD